MVESLLDIGADPTIQINGWYPIHYAVASRSLDSVRILISYYPKQIASLTKNKSTPLHMAVSSGVYNIVLFLLKHNADPNARNAEDHTPFYIATAQPDVSIMKALLSYDAIYEPEDMYENPMALRKHYTFFENLLSGNGEIPKKEALFIDDNSESFRDISIKIDLLKQRVAAAEEMTSK